MTILFESDFESGLSFVGGNQQGSPTIVNNPVHHGLYAMQTANNINSEIWLYLAEVQSTHMRFLWQAPAIANAVNVVGLAGINSSWTQPVNAFLVTAGLNRFWRLNSPTTGDGADVAATINPAQWYTIEIERTVGGASGIARLWVDDVLIINRTAEMITTGSGIYELGNIDSTANFVCVDDCLRIATEKIGMESTNQPIVYLEDKIVVKESTQLPSRSSSVMVNCGSRVRTIKHITPISPWTAR